MPIESEFGLDYGPAALDFDEALKNSEKQVASGKRKKPLTLEDLRYAAGSPEGDAALLGAAQGQELPETEIPDLSATTAGEVASAQPKPVMSIDDLQKAAQGYQSPNEFGDTPEGLVKQLVVKRGMKFGDALTTIREMYDKNSPYVRSLPNIDQFIEQMPGTLKLSIDKMLMKAGEPVARVAELLAGKNPDLLDVDATVKLHDEVTPHSTVAELAGFVPEMALWATLQGAALPVAARAVRFATLTPEAEALIGAVRAGSPLPRELLGTLGSRARYWASQIASFYAATSGTNLLYSKEEPFMPSAFDVGIGVGGYALGSLFRRKSVDAALKFIEQSTGIKGVAQRVDTLDKMLVALKATNEPGADALMRRVIKEGAETYGADFGNYVGRWAARTDLGEKGLEDIITHVGHEGFGKAAKAGFESASEGVEALKGMREGFVHTANYMKGLGATDEEIASIALSPHAFSEGSAKWLGRWAASTGQDVELLEKLTGELKPRYYKTAIDEYNNTLYQMGYSARPEIRKEAQLAIQGEKLAHKYQGHMVVDAPKDIGGAQKYFAPYSQAHLSELKSWPRKKEPPNITLRQFKNPVEVEYAANQIPGYALITRLKGNPKMTAASLQVLDNAFSKANALPQSQVNDIIEGIGNQLAKRFGYDSIIYKGATPDRNMYVDLRNVVPLDKSTQKIVDRFEKSMQAAGRRAVGRNFLSIAAPVVGGLAAWDLSRPEKSEAMPLEDVAKGVSRVFKVLISPSGQEVIGHEVGAMSHYDMVRHLDEFSHIPEYGAGKSRALRETIQNGGLRAGRDDNGPYVEFYWNHEKARNQALNFVKDYHQPGDVAIAEIHFPDTRPDINMYGSLADVEQAIKTGEAPKRVSRMRDFLGIAIPVGVGMGLMMPPDQADAIELGPLLKLASKFKTMDEFVEQLPKQTASVMKQAAILSDKGDPSEVVQMLKGVQDDLFNANTPNIGLEYTAVGPDFLGVNITHQNLGPFPLANVFGVVDPHNGTWYPQVSATPLGYNKDALQKLGEKVKSEHSFVRRLANPKSLAGVVAASYMLKDFVWPESKAEAAEIPVEPIIKAFGQGIRGVADDVLVQASKAKNTEELLNSMFERIKGVQKKVAARDLRGESAAGDAWLRFDTNGGLSEESQQFLGSLDSGEGFNSLYRWRPPWSMTENPLWQVFLGKLISLKDGLLTGEGSTNALIKRRAGEIMQGVPKEDYPELYRAVHGMQTTSTGGVLQTAPNISKRINDVAELLHREVVDPLWVMNTGIDPRAYAIFDELGLAPTEANFRMVKDIQNKPIGAPNPRGAGAAHEAASIRAADMLNWKPWNTIRVPYKTGKFTIMPIRNERAALVEEISRMKGLYGPRPMPDQLSKIEALEKRIADLDRGDIEFRNMQKPKMDVMGLKHTPVNSMFRRNLPTIPEETQYMDFLGEKPGQGLLDHHIDNSLSKAFFDEMLTYAKFVRDQFASDPLSGSRPLADYTVEFMNTLRGLKSVREDLGFAHLANSIAGIIGSDAKFNIADIRNYASKVMEITWLTKLGIGLRFPIVNITQPMLTVAPITGIRSLVRAYARVMNDPAIWKEARAANLLKLESGMRAEVEPSKLSQVLDYIPSKSENLNRVVAYAAAKDQALDEIARTGSLKVPHFVRTFNRETLGSGDAEKIAREYGAAVTRTTQFLYGPEGRPLMFSGGSVRRIMTQFKTFASAYLDFLGGTARHAKLTGDAGPLGRALTSLVLLGGPGTILPYELVRRQALKSGIELPNEQSGIGLLLSTAASTFAQPETADQVKQALNLLQVSGSFNPLPMTLGGNPEGGILQGVLGPTFGAAAQPLLTGYKYAMGVNKTSGQPTTAQDVGTSFLRSISPLIPSAMEASQMANLQGNILGHSLNEWYSKLGYRGAIYSPTGRLQYQPQPGLMGDAEIAMRALNLRPSPRGERYEYIKDIKAAMEGGQIALAQKLLRQAENQGFKFTNQDFGGKPGKERKKPKEFKPNEDLR